MKKVVPIIISVVLTAVFTFSLTAMGFILVDLQSADVSEKISEIQEYIDRYAVFDFSYEQAEKAAISGYLSGLDDEYTEYLTEEEYLELLAANQGNFTGIGVNFLISDPIADGLFIYRVLDHSPAEAAGLKAGDLITHVNGVSVVGRNYDDVYADLSVATGEVLSFTVSRGGDILTVSVTFSEFVQNYVSYRMIGDLGFIRIHSFMPPASDEFQTALNDLLSQGAKGFIFDLRNNPGGSLDAVESILDFLIPKGEEMVVIQFKDSEEIHYAKIDPKTDAPMVVLMNSSSASASELMASCLRDVNGSALIGARSFGKGIGQTTYQLSDGSTVKLTTFHYLTKARNYYHGVGLNPDVSVELTEEQEKYFYTLDESNDPQLQAAISHLTEKLAG